jgi:hypothetical protein
MFKWNGNYYLITSHLSGSPLLHLIVQWRNFIISSIHAGWAPNPMQMYYGGPVLKNGTEWTLIGNPTGSPSMLLGCQTSLHVTVIPTASYNSQSTNVILFPNNENAVPIYQGDRWNYAGPGGLLNATYLWLPINVCLNNPLFISNLRFNLFFKPTSSNGLNFTIPYEVSWSLP